jgi:hypothetical protein
MTLNLKEINSKLKSERRAKQNVSRNQVECAKLTKQVSKLTAQIDGLTAELRDTRAASAKLVPAKQSDSKPVVKKELASRKTNAQAEVTSLVVPRKRKDC